MVINWVDNQEYSKYDAVSAGGVTFYSLVDRNVSTPVSSNQYDLNDIPTKWADENWFVWVPSYTSSISNAADNVTVPFGDGYEKASPKGINNIPLKLKYVFETISDKQSFAILNFLNEKGGEPFVAFVPAPYNRNFYFTATNWTHNFNYVDSNTIEIDLEETFLPNTGPFQITDVTKDYDQCNFEWDYMREKKLNQYLNLPPYELGSYGDKLFVFSALCTDSGQIEDFIVKTEEAAIAADGIGTYRPPADTFSFVYKPINYVGMIIGYVKLSTSNGPKPTATSVLRRYTLDNQVYSIWIEQYGAAGFAFKSYEDGEGFFTPQYIAVGFNPNLSIIDYQTIVDESKAGFDYWLRAFNGLGIVAKFSDYMLYYWIIKGWRIDAQVLVNFYTAKWVDSYNMKPERPFISHNSIVQADPSSNNFRALLNPANCQVIDTRINSAVGGIKPYTVIPELVNGALTTDGTRDVDTDKLLNDGGLSGFVGPQGGPDKGNTRITLDMFGNKAIVPANRPTLNDDTVYGVNIQFYTRNVFNGILSSITDPALQSYSVGGGYIGKLNVGFGTEPYSIVGSDYNYTSMFTFAGGYLQDGARYSSTQTRVLPAAAYAIKTPSWIGALCLSHRARHYPAAVRQQFYDLQV